MKTPLVKLPKLPKNSKFLGTITDISFWKSLVRLPLPNHEKSRYEHESCRDWILNLLIDSDEVHKYQEKRWYTDE